MKEALLEKIRYLLGFKLNQEGIRYKRLLETIFLEFIETLESMYNDNSIPKATYYSNILNRFNNNIKTILIPSEKFCYHASGFLEFATNLNGQLLKYQELNIPITKEIKEEVLKKKYFYYMLQVLKNTKEGVGFIQTSQTQTISNVYVELEKGLNELQAITLAKMEKNYKIDYKTVYPDGTRHHYFIYTKSPSSSNILIVNAMLMLETLIGKDVLLNAQLRNDPRVLKKFDEEYEHLLGKLRYDKYGNIVYTPITVIGEFLSRIRKESSIYKKLEYFKKLNRFLIEVFDYKVTKILNQKNEDKIKQLEKDIKIFELYSIYNINFEQNAMMEHIKILKKTRNKLKNYNSQGNQQTEKKYVIYNLDKTKKEVVSSSVQPIQIEDKYVLIHILDIRSMNNKILIKVHLNVLDLASFTTKIYSNIYISVKELKNLYSSADLQVATRESEMIRNAIANRAYNPTIMDIIQKERKNFLGEFIYSKEQDRCIIYKNQSIEEALEKN